MNYERNIKFAFDNITGEIINADEVLDNRLIGYTVRKKYNCNDIAPHCLECGNKLSVSTSKYDNIHFRHFPIDDYCLLKDELLSPKEKKLLLNIYRAKESDRHKYLKNVIGKSISKVYGISDIYIDNKFIFNSKGKRKPDVYFKYFDKEIVFEIQLSTLSQKYILNRHEFYRSKGIYLIWILDNFDVTGQTQMEKDIKYLSKHQNFFKLNESKDTFSLTCKYKITYLSNDNKYMDRWNEINIDLDKLKFDNDNFEVYFYNFGQEKENILTLQNLNARKLHQENLKKEALQQKERINQKIDDILYEIKWLKEKHIPVYKNVTDKLREFEENELEEFNLKLNLDKNKKLIEWIKNAKSNDYYFIKFILGSHYIEYDCNLVRDIQGKRIIDYLYDNKELPFLYFFKILLKKGHKFSLKDEQYIKSFFSEEKHKAQSLITISYLANQFDNHNFRQYLLDFETIVCIIESAKNNQIIGYKYKPNEWINFVNNVIQYYPKYWEYIELAFKHFGLFDRLVSLDLKKSFQKKLYRFYSKEINTDYSFEYLFRALYPEI